MYQIAKAYVSQTDVPLRRCLFVFPSRRSSLFFQKYLGQCSDAPLLSPDIITIGDLFARLSPYRKGDKIEMLYILWQQYNEICNKHDRKGEGFDEFVSLGETVLSDFGDVDKYLVDYEKLFANVQDLHALESDYAFLNEDQREALRRFWNVIKESKDTKQTKDFLGLWDMLDELYVATRSALASRGIAYEGMLQRDVVDRINSSDNASLGEKLSAYDRIVVIGQNALCRCEMELLEYIRTQKDGDFYWDFFGKCLQDTDNKASLFITGYKDKYKPKYQIEAEVTGEPDITVVAASSAVAQAKVAAQELASAAENSTAVILPDENLLMPLLNSIPDNIEHINVTMGYGLHNSSTASLMDMMAALQINHRDKRGFYHKDVTAILNHPFIREACPESSQTINKDLVAKNMIYVDPSVFAADDLLKQIFCPKKETDEIASWQMGCIEAIAPSLPGIEREFAHGYFTAVSHLRDLHIEMNMKTYFRFLREVTSRLTVDFYGEPLSGLQVMGPLEVRAIDFDTLIILSVNEGVFPSKAQSDSLIPYNVRRGFGLPTPELFDSIAAYHFYRSIYRAKKVVLVYDSRTKGTLSGEESRFVKQLKYHYEFPITFQSVDLEIEPVDGKVHSVPKTDDLMKKMRELCLEGSDGKRLSASALNDYLACPLKFYYKYVTGLKEEDDINEDLDSSKFGNTFHRTMETVYKRAGKGTEITRDLLKSYLDEDGYIEGLVCGYLNDELKQPMDAPLGRRNQITANLIAKMVRTTLEQDAEYAPFTLIDTEQLVYGKLGISVAGVPEMVRLRGFIDRLDQKKGKSVRICDYKTGYVEELNKYTVNALDSVFEGKNKTSFQMLMYALMLSSGDYAGQDFKLSVYGIKKLCSDKVVEKPCSSQVVSAYKDKLKELVEKIFDKSIPFDGVEAGNKACDYCPAKAICGR